MYNCTMGHPSKLGEVMTIIPVETREVTYLTFRRTFNRKGQSFDRPLSKKVGREIVRESSVCADHLEQVRQLEMPVVQTGKVVLTILDKRGHLITREVTSLTEMENRRTDAERRRNEQREAVQEAQEAQEAFWDNLDWEE